MMTNILRRPRIWLFVGLVLMLAGALDPLEGSVVILVGVAISTLGGFIGHDRRLRRQLIACALIVVGVGFLFGLSAVGGVGGSSGRSMWWLVFVLPYPIGWGLGLVGVIQMLRHSQGPTPALPH